MEKSVIGLYILVILLLILNSIILYVIFFTPDQTSIPIYIINLDLGMGLP